MAYEDITALLGGWPGFRLVDVRREGATLARPVPRIVLTLEAVPGQPRRCHRCGEVVGEVHEVTPRKVRDLPILDAETWLVVPRVRLRCPRCGPAVEVVPWLDRYQRMTKRFAESVARLAQVLPIKQVAAHYGLSWDTVKALDRAALEARLGPVELTGIRQIAIDEFAIQKGHRYATSIVDPVTRKVLWVGRGCGREDIRPFFELLGPAGCAQLEAAVMDMSEAYEQEVRAHCPQAVIVYDLFHVVAKYGREVIDRVRVDLTNRLARAAGPGRSRARRRVIKGTRWLLLKNRANVTRPQDRVRLREVLAANRPLWVVYVLKDALKRLWRYRYRGAAQRAWTQWYGWAIRSRLPALVTFARRLKAKLPGILAHCRYPLHTGVLEGINNKIKVIKRMAYGFRDDAYFFLKIRAAFPGNP
jgi:transposase